MDSKTPTCRTKNEMKETNLNLLLRDNEMNQDQALFHDIRIGRYTYPVQQCGEIVVIEMKLQ